MASKKKQKKPTPPPPPVRNKPPRAASAPAGPSKRQQERAARQSAAKRDSLRRALTTAGLIALVAALIAGYLLYDRRQDAELREALTSGSCEVDRESDRTAPQGQNHVPNPSYRVNPPAGGDHLPSAARAGVYSGQQVPTDGLLVHSLEHGYVIAWYEPDLPADQLAELKEFQAAHEDDVIVAERPGMPVPVAATAWGQRLLCERVEPEALQRFADEYIGKGPEDVDRG